MDPEKKGLNSIFHTKYAIPKSLKFSHWPSKVYRDPYSSFLYSKNNWVGFRPLHTPINQGPLITDITWLNNQPFQGIDSTIILMVVSLTSRVSFFNLEIFHVLPEKSLVSKASENSWLEEMQNSSFGWSNFSGAFSNINPYEKNHVVFSVQDHEKLLEPTWNWRGKLHNFSRIVLMGGQHIFPETRQNLNAKG